jgi:hypothetical protein
MGEQQTASATGGRSPSGASSGGSSGTTANPRENTARVVMRGNELPGWFWGLLGCLSVLGVGSAVLFLIFKPPGGLTAPAPSLAVTAAPADRAPVPGARQIDIEPMAPPPPSPAVAGVPKPKAVSHPLKIARSPSAPHPAAAPVADTDKGDDKATEAETGDSDDAPKANAKAKVKAPAADSDDDQAAGARKTSPSDDKSDDKEL